MVYLSGLRFPDRAQEANHMAFSPRARQTCYDSYYPFGLFEGRTLPANVRTRSNGESALAVFSERIREDALYLLDEPENSLSPERQLELARFLHDSARFYNCQFVIATHSPFCWRCRGRGFTIWTASLSQQSVGRNWKTCGQRGNFSRATKMNLNKKPPAGVVLNHTCGRWCLF